MVSETCRCTYRIFFLTCFLNITMINIHIKHRQLQFYTLRRMALAFALIKQMLKLENRSKESCTLTGTCGLQAEQQLVQKNNEASLPQPHKNQLLAGLRSTLELNIFHRWPGLSCSPLPQGVHQTLLPLQLKLKGVAVRQRDVQGNGPPKVPILQQNIGRS